MIFPIVYDFVRSVQATAAIECADPGNAFVTKAEQSTSGLVKCYHIARPTEILIPS